MLEDLQEILDEKLVNQIRINTKRYVNLLQEVAESLIPERNKIFTMEEEFQNLDQVLYSQRNENMRQLD